MIPIPAPDLQQAMETYRRAFGHAVPVEVATLFSRQPGPLLAEIRQAVALQRPVPAWQKLARRNAESLGRGHEVPGRVHESLADLREPRD